VFVVEKRKKRKNTREAEQENTECGAPQYEVRHLLKKEEAISLMQQ